MNSTRASSFHVLWLAFKIASRVFPRAGFPIASRAGPIQHMLPLRLIFLELDYMTVDAAIRTARADVPYSQLRQGVEEVWGREKLIQIDMIYALHQPDY